MAEQAEKSLVKAYPCPRRHLFTSTPVFYSLGYLECPKLLESFLCRLLLECFYNL